MSSVNAKSRSKELLSLDRNSKRKLRLQNNETLKPVSGFK